VSFGHGNGHWHFTCRQNAFWKTLCEMNSTWRCITKLLWWAAAGVALEHMREPYDDDQRCMLTWVFGDGAWRLLAEQCTNIVN